MKGHFSHDLFACTARNSDAIGTSFAEGGDEKRVTPEKNVLSLFVGQSAKKLSVFVVCVLERRRQMGEEGFFND